MYFENSCFGICFVCMTFEPFNEGMYISVKSVFCKAQQVSFQHKLVANGSWTKQIKQNLIITCVCLPGGTQSGSK